MADLPKFTLQPNKTSGRWDLVDDATGKPVRSFDTKAEATAGGVLERSIGAKGGSVKIRKTDGRFEEERTFPRSADPRGSKG